MSKITDKIVTSVTLPQQTNVLWHNPETGELKMFGNKGWTTAGGKGGSDDDNGSEYCGGYPIWEILKLVDLGAYNIPTIFVLPNSYIKIKTPVECLNASPMIDYNALYADILPCISRTFADIPLDNVKVEFNGQPIMLNIDVQKYFEMGMEYVEMFGLYELITIPYYCATVTFNNVSTYLMLCPSEESNFLSLKVFATSEKSFLDPTCEVFLFETHLEYPLFLKSKDSVLYYDNGCYFITVMGELLMCGIVNNVTTIIDFDGSKWDIIDVTSVGLNLLEGMAFLEMSNGKLKIGSRDFSSLAPITCFAIDTGDSISIVVEDYIGDFVTSRIENLLSNNSHASTKEYIIDAVITDSFNWGSELSWTNDNPPTFDGTTRHVISILDGVGCYTVVPAQTEEETT